MGRPDRTAPPLPPDPYGTMVQALAQSNERVLAEVRNLLGRMRAERQALTDEFHRNYTDANGVMTWTDRACTNDWKMTGLLVIVPPGTTSAVLEVGEIQLDVQNTFLELHGLGRLVKPQDVRRLTIAPAITSGTDKATVWLWGYELPLTDF